MRQDTQNRKKKSRSLCFKLSKLSTKERATEEKVPLSILRAVVIFKQKKRYADLQSKSLWIEEEMTEAQARVNIYEKENIDQKVPFKTLAMVDIKAGDGRYQ